MVTSAVQRRAWPEVSHKRLALGLQRHRGRVVRTAGGRIGQWWSPPWLAELLARWARIRPGDRVLDAGAGRGALGLAALERGADVVLLERDRRYADALEREHGDDCRVMLADFLEDELARLVVDVVVTNPPWEDDFPERFLARACELADRCVAILPLNVLCGVERSEKFWRSAPIEITRARALARRPRFLGAKSGMRDVVLLEVRPRAFTGPQRFTIEVGDV